MSTFKQGITIELNGTFNLYWSVNSSTDMTDYLKLLPLNSRMTKRDNKNAQNIEIHRTIDHHYLQSITFKAFLNEMVFAMS